MKKTFKTAGGTVLALGLLAVMVAAANTIYTNTGNIIMDPAGGDVDIGDNQLVSYTSTNEKTILKENGIEIGFGTDEGDVGITWKKDTAAYYNWFIDDSVSDTLRLYDYTAGAYVLDFQPNADTTLHASGDDLFLTSADLINLQPDGVAVADGLRCQADTSGTVCYPVTDNEGTWGTASNKFADIQSYLINGADICFENQICMTECVNDINQIDICFVYGKPTEDQRKSIGLADTETYIEYVERHSDEGVFDNSMTETEFNTRRSSILNNGKLDFRLGRESRMSLREVKDALDRLDDIEQTLCNQGIQKYC